MRNRRRILGLALSLVMLLALVPTAAGAAQQFTDVPSTAWYYKDVQKAVQTGLVNGKTPTTYAPNDELTYAEAVKLAACMYKYADEGGTSFPQGSPWYQPYVDYAKAKGIITMDYSWTTPATRAAYMDIFSRALPEKPKTAGLKGLTPINTVADGAVPDVPMSHPQAAAIYTLYRAGIVQGNDKQYRCLPGSTIKRSEVAAILTRMIDPASRVTFTIGETAPVTPTAPLKLKSAPKDAVVKIGEKASLSVTVTGGKAPYTFTWQHEVGKHWGESAERWTVMTEDTLTAFSVSGATGTLTIQPNGEKFYLYDYPVRCVVTDADGATVTTGSFRISQSAVQPLAIVLQPKDTTADVDETAAFTIGVTGGKAPYTFTWRYDYGTHRGQGELWADVDLEDGTAAVETAAAMSQLSCTPDSAKYYLFTYPLICVVTDASGATVVSESVQLGYEPQTAPLTVSGTVDVSYTNEELEAGFVQYRAVQVTGGTPPYTYQWQKWGLARSDGRVERAWVDCTGETAKQAKYQIDATDFLIKRDMKFRCIVTDAAGVSQISDTINVLIED